MKLDGLNIPELRDLERRARRKVRDMFVSGETGIDRVRNQHAAISLKLQEVIMDAQHKWKAREREIAEIDRELNECYAKARALNTQIEDLQERRRIAAQDKRILEHILDKGNNL